MQDGDVDTFKQRLSQVEEFFQNHDNTMKGLAASGALCYAARAGSIRMIDTLIQKGVGKAVLRDEQQQLAYMYPMHLVACMCFEL